MTENKFNEEQLKFINSDIQDICLCGIPGGGKSTCIAEYLYRKIKNKKLKNSEFRVLTFSRNARYSFIDKSEKYKKIIGKNIFTTTNVHTFHSFSYNLLKKIFNKTSNLSAVIVATVYHLKNMSKEKLINKSRVLKRLKVLIVDESQDMSHIQYQFCVILAKILNIKLILVGDPNQNIYQFQGGSDEYMLDWYKQSTTKKIHLKINYRSTQEIVDFVNEMRPHKYLTPEMISGNKDKGTKPIIIKDNTDNILKDLKKSLIKDKETMNLKNIAIIGPVKKCKDDNENLSLGLQLIVNLCEKNNIEYIKHYTDGNKKSRNKGVIYENNKLNIFTGHGCKGLEFEKVYVLNFNFWTHNCNPNLHSYNEFKYLWYVILSRAQKHMKIYSCKSNYIWPELEKIDVNLYETNNNLFYGQYNFREQDNLKITSSVTECIENMKPEDNFNFENMIDYKIVDSIKIYKKLNFDCNINGNNFSQYFGHLVDNIFEMIYLNNIPSIVQNIEFNIDNTLILPDKYYNIYKNLKNIIFIDDNTIDMDDLKIKKNLLKKNHLKLFNYIVKKCPEQKDIHIEQESILIYKNNVEIKNIIKLFKNEKDQTKSIKLLIKLIFYKYQKEYQYGSLWKQSTFDIIYQKIYTILDKIYIMTDKIKNMYTNLEFQKTIKYNNIDIIGRPDCKQNNKCYDVKFTKEFNNNHILQLFFYNGMLDNTFLNFNFHGIFNFRLGEIRIYKFQIKNNFNIWDIYKFLSDISTLKLNNMLFVYDFETTGDNPYDDEITERHFQELNTKVIPSTGILKTNKPITPFISKLTGITQEMVNNGEPRNIFENQMKEINKYCHKPMFIAHNGNAFDHIIFKRYIDKNIFYNFLFKDSRYLLRLFTENISNDKLGEIYHKLIGKKLNAHRAKSDTIMLSEILCKLNITYTQLNQQYN